MRSDNREPLWTELSPLPNLYVAVLAPMQLLEMRPSWRLQGHMWSCSGTLARVSILAERHTGELHPSPVPHPSPCGDAARRQTSACQKENPHWTASQLPCLGLYRGRTEKVIPCLKTPNLRYFITAGRAHEDGASHQPDLVVFPFK